MLRCAPMRLPRVATLVLTTLSIAGCLCLGAAMVWYPGGSWWEPNAVGASLVDTFLCDLMASHTPGGWTNPVGSRFGRAGMALLVAALLLAWWLVGALESESTARRTVSTRRRRVARVVGIGGLIPLAVALATPGAWLHAVVIPAAGLLEFIALGLATAGAIRSARLRVVGLLGGGLGVVVLVGLGYYWPTISHGELACRGLPAIQKLGVVILSAWMVAIAHATWTRPLTSHRRRPSISKSPTSSAPTRKVCARRMES
jgi:uncharacterized membrane protein